MVERLRGARPSTAAADALMRLTEGWPAGVLLAAKASRWLDPATLDEALTGGDLEREVYPYLAEQVYAPKTPGCAAFSRVSPASAR